MPYAGDAINTHTHEKSIYKPLEVSLKGRYQNEGHLGKMQTNNNNTFGKE